jgi:serine phosphatase RsbU (regulator of sigma subunit)
MGQPFLLAGRQRKTHDIALKPGDRVLMYTDGVTEARSGDGGEFGLEQFADYVIRAMAAGEPAPETLRRLIRSILESPTSRLRDDATILMFEWTPPPR